MLFTKQELAHLTIETAQRIGVPPELACAIIEVSSGWNAALQSWEPEPWLLNSHPNDYAGGETEWIALGTRWGLMQFLGSKAKAAKYTPISPELIEPRKNLEAGCLILKAVIGNGEGSTKGVLQHWYGIDRRSLVGATMAVLPSFETFVRERPLGGAAAGKAASDSSQTRQPTPSVNDFVAFQQPKE